MFAPKKNAIDYEGEGDQSWIDYLHENLEESSSLGSSFPESCWKHGDQDSPDVHLHGKVMKGLYDSEVDASFIESYVINGRVLLSGRVKSDDARIKAEEVVSSLPEVWSVINQLEVERPS